MTPSPTAYQEEQPRLGAVVRSWQPATGSSAPAIEPAQEDARFVFHDPGGRRWSRIGLVAVIGALALAVLGGGVAVAVTRVAPGRAPAFTGNQAQPVPNWQVHASGGATAPAAAEPGPAAAEPAPAAGPAATPAVQPSQAPTAPPTATPTLRPSPTPTKRPTPRHTP